MNIFNKVTLQSMKKSRSRTIVTIIGVVLSAALITGVATFGVSLLNYMTQGAIKKYGDWHVAFPSASSSFIQEQTKEEGIATTTVFNNIGYSVLAGIKIPDKPYFFIAGFNEETFHSLPLNLISGRLPENSAEIVVPLSVEAKGGVKIAVGDKLTLSVGNRMSGNKNLGQNMPYLSGHKTGTVKETLVPKYKKTYTVVGICGKLNFEEASAPGYTLITKAAEKDKGDSFSLFVTLTNPRKLHAYISRNAGSKAYILNDYLLRFMGLSDDNIINLYLYSVGGIIIIIIIIGSIFLIYNAFTISLNERIRQFGILSSVGATAKQLRNSVLFEGLCIGAVGIPIGIIVGLGSIGLVIFVVSKSFRSILYNNVPFTMTVSLPAIAAAAVVSMVTILISAYIPARIAANTPIMESIRQTNDVKVESKAVQTSKLAGHIYGLEGVLALKNFKRNKKRYRSIVLSLVLSVVLFVSASAFVTDMKQASERAAVVTDYDIGFATQDMKDSKMLQLYDRLKTADGVYESSYQALMKYTCTAKAGDLSDSYEMLEESRNTIFIANVFAYTFIIMISLIAVANVFNTISTNIKLRRRELAMLRSVGMSERDFQKMMNFECAFYGMRALLFGLPLAAISSWLIYKGMFAGGADSIDYVFPWGSMAISVFSVLFVVFVTMLYAISKLKKENIIDALRDDMT